MIFGQCFKVAPAHACSPFPEPSMHSTHCTTLSKLTPTTASLFSLCPSMPAASRVQALGPQVTELNDHSNQDKSQ